MFKVIILYPWPADPARFKSHYVSRHAPLCQAIPGARRASYAFEPSGRDGPSEWFCVFEAEYENEGTWRAAMATPEAKAAQADVANYSASPPTIIICKPTNI